MKNRSLLWFSAMAGAAGAAALAWSGVGAASPTDTTLVRVPAGSFSMGSDSGAADEKPVHRVSGLAFAMDRYEVTNERYRVCVAAGA